MIVDYKAHYDADYFLGKKTYQSPDGATHAYHGPSLTWDGFSMIADSLTALMPGKSVLDVGCSAGSLAAEFLRRGYDAYGIDISEHAVMNAVPSMKGRLALGDISTTPEEMSAYHPHKGPFPSAFDVVMATDLLEHLYQEDLDRTFDWMVAKSNKWLFFCVATCHDPSHGLVSLTNPSEFIHTKGTPVPVEHQGTAVSGHIHVRTFRFWTKYFQSKSLTIRWDLMYLFQLRREFTPAFQATLGWHHGNTFILEKK